MELLLLPCNCQLQFFANVRYSADSFAFLEFVFVLLHLNKLVVRI